MEDRKQLGVLRFFFPWMHEQLGEDAKRGCRSFATLITPRLRGTCLS